jgi:membrane associated rhomboid family serine protease
VRWGLIPAYPQAHAFVTHLFMHGGWLHLVGNLFLFFLAAPPVEDRWGRPLFGAFYLLAGIFAGASHAFMTSSPELPLVGASGAIAGVLGVFFVRFWATKIRFFYFFYLGLFFRTGTFHAPAWLMLPLWFANELLNIYLTAEFGVETGVAYWAHVGGFVFGVGFALTVRAYRLEERFIHPAIEEKVTVVEANPVIEEAMQAREEGDIEKAYGLLEKASLQNPDDPDVVVAFWDTAVSLRRADAAVPAFIRTIRSCTARGEVALAGKYWTELSSWAPAALPDPTTLFKIAADLLERGEDTKAARTLEQALNPTNSGLGPGLAARIVELTRERLPRVALSAAHRALEFPDLHEVKRAAILELVQEMEASGVVSARTAAAADKGDGEASAPWEKAGAIALSEDAEEEEEEKTRGHTLSEFEKFNEFVSMTRFSTAKVVEAAPTLLADRRLHLRRGGESDARIGYRRINAVAVGEVQGLAEKPIVLIDLLLNWSDLDADELRVLRLRSDGFEPSLLLPSASDASQALGKFVEELLARSRAKPLPDRDSACGRPFREFESLDAYQREVLQVEG